jgi:DNA-directed RNA polymerase specialized sigma24 family protein
MTEERDTPDDLYPFAEMLVKQLKKQHQLRWNKHRMEDATQDLFLAGWQVYQDEGDIGLAMNRMVTRVAKLHRDYRSEWKSEPKAASDQHKPAGIPKDGKLWNDDANRDWDASNVLCDWRRRPPEEVAYEDMLVAMPERQRIVVLLRGAGYTDQEIADELGVSLRTVERELSKFREEHKDDYCE